MGGSRVLAGASPRAQGTPAPPFSGLQPVASSLCRAAPSCSGIKLFLGWEAVATTPGRVRGQSQPLLLPGRVRGRGVGAVLGPGSSSLDSGGEGGLGAHSVKMIRGTQKDLGPVAAWRWDVQTEKAERAAHARPVPLPDGASGCGGSASPKGQRRSFPTGPLQDWLPGPEGSSGWVQQAKVLRAQPAKGSPATLLKPRWLLGALWPPSAQRTALSTHLVPICSPGSRAKAPLGLKLG